MPLKYFYIGSRPSPSELQ